MLRLATALLGPNVRFFQARTLLKDNTFGGMVPAHQDWPFFAGDPNKLNLFIPLTRCGLDQGPLIFYEGSHLFGPLDQGDIDVARYPELTPHTVEADVGDVFAAHFLSWHSSVPATSPEPRLYIQLILSDGGDPAASQVLAGVSTNPHYCANFHAPMARPQPSIHTQLARIWLNAGDVDGAARLAEGMLAVEPRNLDAAILLADVDKARGGSGEAQLNWAMERLESLKADILSRLPAGAQLAAAEEPAPRKGLVGRLKGLVGA